MHACACAPSLRCAAAVDRCACPLPSLPASCLPSLTDARGFASIWPAFFDQLGPVLRRVPWVTTVGNHGERSQHCCSQRLVTACSQAACPPLALLTCFLRSTTAAAERDWPGSGDRFPAVIDSGGECGVPYMRYTRMPGPEGGPPSVGSGAGSGRGEGRVAGDIADKPWFSLDFGPVHLLQFSTGARACLPAARGSRWRASSNALFALPS